jgi:hypothetical protein
LETSCLIGSYFLAFDTNQFFRVLQTSCLVSTYFWVFDSNQFFKVLKTPCLVSSYFLASVTNQSFSVLKTYFVSSYLLGLVIVQSSVVNRNIILHRQVVHNIYGLTVL